jgi:hypothetical protein
MEVQCMPAKRRAEQRAGRPLSLRLPADLLRKIDDTHARYAKAGPDLFTRTDIIRLAIEEGLPYLDARVRRDLQKVEALIEQELARRKVKEQER